MSGRVIVDLENAGLPLALTQSDVFHLIFDRVGHMRILLIVSDFAERYPVLGNMCSLRAVGVVKGVASVNKVVWQLCRCSTVVGALFGA